MHSQGQAAMRYQAKDIWYRNIQLNYLALGRSFFGVEVIDKARLRLQVPQNSPYKIISTYHLVSLSVIRL